MTLWHGGRVTLEDLVRLRRARDVMDRDYANPLDVTALARIAFMSPGHFHRSFRAAFGETPYSYLMTRRIERAKALLRDTDMAIIDIAFETGWNSLGTFGRVFRDVTGESPSALRKREQAAHHELERVPHCYVSAAHRPNLKTAVSEKRRSEAGDSGDAEETEVP